MDVTKALDSIAAEKQIDVADARNAAVKAW
jgi:hypothetical protein